MKRRGNGRKVEGGKGGIGEGAKRWRPEGPGEPSPGFSLGCLFYEDRSEGPSGTRSRESVRIRNSDFLGRLDDFYNTLVPRSFCGRRFSNGPSDRSRYQIPSQAKAWA